MRKLPYLFFLLLLFACRKKEDPLPEPEPVLKDTAGVISGMVKQVTAFNETYTLSPTGTKVTLLPEGRTTMVEANGLYKFNTVAAGTYTLQFEKQGCGTILIPDLIYKPGDQGNFDVSLADLPTFSISAATVLDTTWFSSQIPGIYFRASTTETNTNASAVAIISNTGTPVITDLSSYQNYATVSPLSKTGDYNRFMSYAFLKDTYGYVKGQVLKIRIYPVAATNGSYIIPKENRPLFTAHGSPFPVTFTIAVP